MCDGTSSVFVVYLFINEYVLNFKVNAMTIHNIEEMFCLWHFYLVSKLLKVNECTSRSLHTTAFRTWRPFQPVVEWIYAGPLILISVIIIMQYVGQLQFKKRKNYFQLTSYMSSVFF